MVPVASVATARLPFASGLATGLGVMLLVLVAGLINIVYKAAGESLAEPEQEIDSAQRSRACGGPILRDEFVSGSAATC